MDAALRECRREAAPLGTEGTGWDVIWAAVLLASDEARWRPEWTCPYLAPRPGLEPGTCGLTVRRSTN